MIIYQRSARRRPAPAPTEAGSRPTAVGARSDGARPDPGRRLPHGARRLAPCADARRLRRCDPSAPPASDLIAALLAEYDAVAGRHLTGGPSATPDDFSPPAGTYLVGFAEDGEAVCSGGVKALGDGIAEVKRFYVVPAYRGQGLARVLLQALEDAARRAGHRTLRLDTTAPTWPMYVAAGYREVADYNGNPHATVWGEKRL